MKKRFLLGAATVAIIGGASLWAVAQYQQSDTKDDSKNEGIVHYASMPTAQNSNNKYTGTLDFTAAAEQSVQSVVHITTKSDVTYQGWYGTQSVPQTGSGSGVIISKDGYIVTNNHVVKGAKEVKVTFNNYVSKMAKVIGTDPASDLAVLKVEGGNYPYIVFGNSDEVRLGQWVLAVGYPLNLDATVTAGIVSAKSRNIGINQKNSKQYAIESFIQTDAAVNMGNSGGALVSTDGLLVGINSAIATPTGSYAGYSYAIPSNLVRKVVNDIVDFGEVQRGFMGASLIDIGRLDERSLSELGLPKSILDGKTQGVVVANVLSNGGAEAAGMQSGDIITMVNGTPTTNSSILMEQIAMYNPGDKANITYIRNNKSYTSDILLKSQSQLSENTVASNNKKKEAAAMDVYSNSDFYSEKFGFGFKELTDKEREQGVKNGIVVTEIDPDGKLNNFMNSIQQGFVITKINGKDITSASDATSALESGKGLSIMGTYPGTGGSYSFSYR